MLIQEQVKVNEVDLIHSYSDLSMYIIQEDTGLLYQETYDILNSGHTYSESDQKIEPPVKPERKKRPSIVE